MAVPDRCFPTVRRANFSGSGFSSPAQDHLTAHKRGRTQLLWRDHLSNRQDVLDSRTVSARRMRPCVLVSCRDACSRADTSLNGSACGVFRTTSGIQRGGSACPGSSVYCDANCIQHPDSVRAADLRLPLQPTPLPLYCSTSRNRVIYRRDLEQASQCPELESRQTTPRKDCVLFCVSKFSLRIRIPSRHLLPFGRTKPARGVSLADRRSPALCEWTASCRRRFAAFFKGKAGRKTTNTTRLQHH